jgi:hypothetical protein
MRVTLLAAFAAVLLACQQPTAPEADEKLDQAISSPALGNDQAPPETEEHQGC